MITRTSEKIALISLLFMNFSVHTVMADRSSLLYSSFFSASYLIFDIIANEIISDIVLAKLISSLSQFLWFFVVSKLSVPTNSPLVKIGMSRSDLMSFFKKYD